MQFTPPITYTDDDGTEYEYDSFEFLAQDVEFANDFNHDYKCRDATGQRFRLIVSGMTLLLAQPVPNDFTASRLELREFPLRESVALTEEFQGIPLRLLVRDHRSAWKPMDLSRIDSVHDKVVSEVSLEEFDDMWVRGMEDA
ncbi:hypothetical protein AB0E06_39015 [Streptomyces sp. NPDC048109]|uniref:hypothetical protein n=1 Tax=Streptomyces sp. NPDC048109 TaxID=3155482 RepID=UPI00343725C5